ncbi:hypothetical protein Gotur_030109 [Gossypium turneri]
MEKTNFVSAFLAMDINSKKLSAISLWALCYGQDLSFVKTKDLTAGMKRNGLWRPPKPGIIKLNFDSSFVSNSNFSISAVIARDFEGLIMGACTYPIVDVAELRRELIDLFSLLFLNTFEFWLKLLKRLLTIMSPGRRIERRMNWRWWAGTRKSLVFGLKRHPIWLLR